jgi:hypothetical protein
LEQTKDGIVKNLIKVLASLFIAYHLLAIITFPMTWSIWGRTLDPYLAPYGNSFGMNVAWQFFSPLPSPTMYIEYVIVRPENSENLENETVGYWPPRDRRGYWRENWLRRTYSARYFGNDQNRMGTVFGAWLCRQNKGAEKVEMAFFVYMPPPMNEMLAGRSFKELGKLQKLSEVDWSCPAEESAL